MKKHDLTNTHLHRKSPGKALYAAFVGVTMAAMLCQPVFAATVWEKANEIMKDVYKVVHQKKGLSGMCLDEGDHPCAQGYDPRLQRGWRRRV